MAPCPARCARCQRGWGRQEVNAIDNVGRDLSGHVIVRLKGRRDTLRVSQAFAYRFRQM
jgi:hypothetical protein